MFDRSMPCLRSLLVGAGLAILAAAQESPGIPVRILPPTLHKVADPGRATTESWIASLIVGKPGQALEPTHLEVRFFAKDRLLATQALEAAAIAKLPRNVWQLTDQTPAMSTRHLYHVDSSFDLLLWFSQPRAFAIDRIEIAVSVTETVTEGTVTDGKAAARALPTATAAVQVYQQKTDLAFPWHGPSIMTQGWFNNGGHTGQSSWFAGDYLGLTADTWGPMLRDEDVNEAFAGFRRPVLSPADGTIVAMRNDVPTNAKVYEEPPPAFLAALHDPLQAILGNHVVIDHGNDECSLLAHLDLGSITVKVGDRVRQGQAIAKVGNTGNAENPHLHYELMDGPHPFVSNGLPHRFTNVSVPQLDRGTYFSTR